MVASVLVAVAPVAAETPQAPLTEPAIAAAAASPEQEQAVDARRGRRGLKDRNEAINVFEVTYAEGFSVNHGRVLRLYRAFFDREPDLQGALFWLDRYDEGWTIEAIADFFATSTEYRTVYGNATDAQHVELTYLNVLDRSPDTAGRDYWMSRLTGSDAISRGTMVTLFSDSIEFRSRHPYPQPVEPGGPSPSLPAVPSGSSYRVDVAAWNIPTNGTNAPATTANMQAAIDWAAEAGHTKVTIPAGTYLVGVPTNPIYSGGISLRSDTIYELESGAVIQLATHERWNACAVAIGNATDVVLRGGTIRGDRDTHIFTPRERDGKTSHDEGHNLCIQSGAKRVLVEDMLFQNATGDGILIVGNRSQGSITDVTIRNSEFDNNRRQGISIVGGIRIVIDSNEIHHTNGTSPQFGIDIESLSHTSRDIVISRNDFHHNAGGHIVNTDGRNVLIEYNQFIEGDGYRNVDGALVTWPRADQTIRYNHFEVRDGSVNGKVAIIGYSSGKSDRNPATTYVYENTSDGGGMYWYETSRLEVRNNTIDNGYLVMRDVSEVTIMDNEVNHSNKCWAYRFLRVGPGQASGNTYAGEPFDIAINNGPWTGCWIN